VVEAIRFLSFSSRPSLNQSRIHAFGVIGLCKPCANRIRACRLHYLAFLDGFREQVREPADRPPEVVKLGPAVDGHRQLRVAVPGQLHCLLERGPAFIQEGDEAVPEGMEIGVQQAVRSLNGVGYTACFQVDAEHFGGITGGTPGAGPNLEPGRPVAEVVLQHLGHIRRQRLHRRSAILGLPS
jgi:hypothetical protein